MKLLALNKRMKIGVAAVSVFVLGILVGAWGAEYVIRYQAERYGADAHLGAAFLASKDRDFDKAQGHAYAALSAHPNWVTPYILLGEIFSETGNIDAALAMFRIAVEKTAYEQPPSALFGLHGKQLELEKDLLLRKIDTLMKSQK